MTWHDAFGIGAASILMFVAAAVLALIFAIASPTARDRRARRRNLSRIRDSRSVGRAS